MPSVYIMIYGIYLILGPVDLYEDGTKNFYLKNPKEKKYQKVQISTENAEIRCDVGADRAISIYLFSFL